MLHRPTTDELARVNAMVEDFYTEYLSKTLLGDPLTKPELSLLKTFCLYQIRAKKDPQEPDSDKARKHD
jgi:hypothetical protein